MTWQPQITALLTASIVRPLALAAAAWLILSIFRVRHPASRHAVWTAVLVGTLILPILSVLAPHWKLPLLPVSQSAASQNVVSVSSTAAPDEPFVFAPSAKEPASQLPAHTRPTIQTLIVWCYFAGLLAIAAYHLIGSALLWRVISRSHFVRTTRIRESGDVLTPVAVGILRPSVILPEGWRNWNAGMKRAVLAHEFAHLRRGDTLVSALARFAKCVLWFHPLVWWLSRQISEFAELSCDAAALEQIDDPARYSRILLAFADAVNRAGYRAFLPGLAIASRSEMSERIDQVFEVAGGNMRKLSRPGMVLATIGLPILCAAATVGLSTKTAPIEIAQAQAAPSVIWTPAIGPRMPPMPKPKFDVVSVRPCGTAGGPSGSGEGGSFKASPGLLRISCASIMTMIEVAYVWNGDKLENNSMAPMEAMTGDQRVKGVPGWAMSARYTIEAKTNDPVANGPTTGRSYPPAQKLMNGPMLQSLLEDRFQLKTHREMEEVPMYNLVMAKGGVKLKPMQQGDCTEPERTPEGGTIFRNLRPEKPYCNWMGGDPHGPNQTIVGGGIPISQLADYLSRFVMDRHVFDKTGLATLFNIHLEFVPDDSRPCILYDCPTDLNSDIPAGPSIFDALEELGLKLEPTKGPRGYIMVDHVDPPSAN